MSVKLYQDGVGRLYAVDGNEVYWLMPLDEGGDGKAYELPPNSEEIGSCREIDSADPQPEEVGDNG